MRRIIIAGMRTFTDYNRVKRAMFRFAPLHDVEIISGTAEGADKLGERFAAEYGLPLKRFPANWDKFGKAAGPIRNAQMAQYAAEEEGILVAFWDGQSKGTKSMINEAGKRGLHVIIERLT